MSDALGNMSKLYCSRLHENFLVYLFTKNRSYKKIAKRVPMTPYFFI